MNEVTGRCATHGATVAQIAGPGYTRYACTHPDHGPLVLAEGETLVSDPGEGE